MSNKYIVSHAGQEIGPLTEDEIKQKLLSHQLLPIDFLYDETKNDWIMLNEKFDVSQIPKSPPPLVKPAAAASAKSTPYPSLNPQMNMVPARKPQVTPPKLQLSNSSSTQSQPLANPPPIKVQPAPTTLSLSPIAVTPADLLVPPPAMPLPGLKTSLEPAATLSKPAQDLESTSSEAFSVASSVASSLAPSSSPATQTLKFNGGVGTVSLKQLHSGRISIRLESHQTSLKIPQETIVQVEAGPAHSVSWQAPSQCRAGEEVIIQLSAKDAYGNPTAKVSQELHMLCRGQKSERFKASFVNGQARIKITWTVAEALSLELQSSSSLQMPAPHILQVVAGPAVGLQIESPSSAVAGETMSFTVRAVDQWGNLATDFTGDVALGFTKAG